MISSACLVVRKGSRLSTFHRVSAVSLRRTLQRCTVPGITALQNPLLRQRFYSTERIVQLRSGRREDDLPKTLYDAKNEKENCGVGLIASLKSVPSRAIVERADEMLVRMAHRGGCGCDPASGDGSGEFDKLIFPDVAIRVLTLPLLSIQVCFSGCPIRSCEPVLRSFSRQSFLQ
jgi:hypothetical protein